MRVNKSKARPTIQADIVARIQNSSGAVGVLRWKPIKMLIGIQQRIVQLHIKKEVETKMCERGIPTYQIGPM